MSGTVTITRSRALVSLVTASVAIGVAAAPTAGADDRSCTSTSGTTTICSRPGGSTSINTSPATVVGPTSNCGFGVGLDYMCGGGVTWNIGGIFNRR